MTALMVAGLIEDGTMDRAPHLFSETEMLPLYAGITVHDLIRHEGGFLGYLARSNVSSNALWDGRDDDLVQTWATLTRQP